MSNQLNKFFIDFGGNLMELVEGREDTKRFKTYEVTEELATFLDEKIAQSFNSPILRYKKTDDSILNTVKNLDPIKSDLAGLSSGQLVVEGTKFMATDTVEKYFDSINLKIFENHKHGPIFNYPPNGGYMGWHTNCKQSRASYRAFFTKGSGYFQYLEDGKVYRVHDSKDWKCNVFYIGDCSDPTWHSIWGGPEGRYSVGYMVEKA